MKNVIAFVMGFGMLVVAMGHNRALASSATVTKQLEELESRSQGRLGVTVCDQTGEILFSYRGNERFPLASTFKLVLVAAVLHYTEDSGEGLDERIHFSQDDLVIWSPKTQDSVAEGMTVRELCAATMQYSDNTAANLLMKKIGGPEAVTEFARSLGDTVFTLKRWEPDLNWVTPGDVSDTTSPEAMAVSLYSIVNGETLRPWQKQLIVEWMKGNTTGDTAIRAGLPQGWECGDKTGRGGYGTSNDIAVLWSPSGKMYVVSIYFTQFEKHAAEQKEVITRTTRILQTILQEGEENRARF